MGNTKLATASDEVVPTYTLAAAFAIALTMGLVVVTGVVFKPYDAKKVVTELHERILYEKEMRELRNMSYGVIHYSPKVVSDVADNTYYPESSYAIAPIAPVPEAKKTERAENFEREVRSDDYWASLQASLQNNGVEPSSAPVVIPPVVVGSAD